MRTRQTLTPALCLLALAAASSGEPAPTEPQTFVVNAADDLDDGSCDLAHCSLREAIRAANADPLCDTIAFAIAGEPAVIHPEAPLPAITQPLVLDGATQPGIEVEGYWLGLHQDGLVVHADGATIRGLTLRGVSDAAIRVRASGVRIEGNTILYGSLGNFRGVLIEGETANVIGGSEPGQGNRIAGDPANPHEMIGIEINQGAQLGGGGTRIEGNEIRDVDFGVLVFGGEGTDLGGLGPGSGNAILDYRKAGVLVQQDLDRTGWVAILGNSIASWEGLGIDLGFDGRSPNDFEDADRGANGLQNFPVIESAVVQDGVLAIAGTLHGARFSPLRIELFASAFGTGGQRLLGAYEGTTDADGNLAFEAAYAVGDLRGWLASATATQLAMHETSEFSDAVVIGPVDRDGDGVPDASDLCPDAFDPGQTDTDGDGAGDACEDDDDGDGVADQDEVAAGTDPLRPDSDADGLRDGADACPLAAPALADLDGDGCTDTLEGLERLVASLSLERRLAAGLLAKLEDARRALAEGKLGVAIHKLEDFIAQVEAKRGRALPDTDADRLVAYARNLIAILSGGL